ncbi:hypothetical protein CY35_02G116900 [Sphagnum magellanicum]|nr:hypothetical protein CY35_02G116900 [Sphagnum magellanicum]
MHSPAAMDSASPLSHFLLKLYTRASSPASCFPTSPSSPFSSPRPSPFSSSFGSLDSVFHTSRVSAALRPIVESQRAGFDRATGFTPSISRFPPKFLFKAFSSSPSDAPPEFKEYKLPPAVNPPDAVNPDPATLREHWNAAVRMYATWYGRAWGTAVLAGFTFFALGWWIKGENPLLPSSKKQEELMEQKPEDGG